MTAFKDSQEANFRRMIRQAIRKADFTKGERDVTLALINHWFHHKGGSKSYIHPGRTKIAKRAGVDVKTVSRCLAMLRASGVIAPLNGLSGGGKTATKYQINVMALLVLCGCDWVNEFLVGARQNVPLWFSEMSHSGLDKMSRSINSVKTHPSQIGVGGVENE